ncbi:SubName: Full=Uncharacterized protein {ECO:0000313/EMBL:CCA72492.1} [Serendipita indica DSM 11827]|uniref:Uncharacterized protein n=1 Tax=Serendipita indica (strain DSM 11827) TaxID=1109443 RepID=G4TME5_SERID|nr:SubName: Full=Uncharacterized protein {ECO:0000313/EMBL:CCA72492.1} [Serendipita indica DSM 11827]CCA72492.1 hypothetical protein PIIN_06427 [Serendipita indica DSM 11827]
MGDLQRMLSVFFNVPITVRRVYVSPTPSPRPIPSPSNPIVQNRRVHLLTAPKSLVGESDASEGGSCLHQRVVCVATSVVRITSEPAAQRFLDERYAIGQVFRILGRVADFHLLEVETGQGNGSIGKPGKEYLKRKYLLKTEGFECEIVEVFVDREMFSMNNQEWLATPDDFIDTDLN